MEQMGVMTMPNYSYTFDFETKFHHDTKREWMTKNWKSSFYYIAAYMIIIYCGRLYMKERRRFEIRKPLIIWNTALAIFSLCGMLRTIPELLYTIRTFGFHHSSCIPSYVTDNTVGAFWTWMFTLSKVPELGDTVFIVLRKQPLIFLHWYHHVTVLVYTWYAYTEYTAPGRWFVAMNYSVHTVMYGYYALKAMKYSIPRSISAVITTMQISQMIVGCYINIYAYQMKEVGAECTVSYSNIKLSLLMYLSYFVLFGRFFYKAYLRPKDRCHTPQPVEKFNKIGRAHV